MYEPDLVRLLRVCPKCSWHHYLPVEERISLLFDEGTFLEWDSNLESVDVLGFPGYKEKLESAVATTGRNDSVVRGEASIGGQMVSVALQDFRFMGGSIGCVSGEKIARTFEYGAERRIPVVIVTASGGARMQEGLFSLMQVAKMIATRGKLFSAGLPFYCVMTDPTMAGALISFAASADFIISEPRARISFSGQRVRRDTGNEHVATVGVSGLHEIVARQELRNSLISKLAGRFREEIMCEEA